MSLPLILKMIVLKKIKIKDSTKYFVLDPIRINIAPTTSAVRAFGPGCFLYFALVLELRHIGMRPKGLIFGLDCQPKP